MTRRRAQSGFTVVEMLIAGLVLVVVLAAASAFFAQQVTLQRSVQTRNELQDRVRVSMALVTQDLALAGNSVLIDTTTGGKDTTVAWPFCFDGGRGCLEADVVASGSTTADPGSSSLRLRYVTSQFPAAQACRDVSYRLADGVLQRSDVVCEADPTFVAIAPDMLQFQIGVVCSTGVVYTAFPTGACGGGTSYARSANVALNGQARTAQGGDTCETGRLCFRLDQQTLIPNMKDK